MAIEENRLHNTIDRQLSEALASRANIFHICELAQEVWNSTPWCETLNLTRAVRLGYNTELSGARTRLPTEEVESIRSWIQDKCRLWNISTPILLRYLESFQRFDHHLLTGVYHDPLRDSKNAHGNKNTDVTPSDIYIIAMCLPGKFELQNKAVEAVRNDCSLSSQDVQKLAKALSQATSLEAADEIIRSQSWRKLPQEVHYFSTLPEPLPSTVPRHELDRLFEEGMSTARDLMRNSSYEAEFSPAASVTIPQEGDLLQNRSRYDGIEANGFSIEPVMLDWIQQVRIWLPRKLQIPIDAAEDCIQEALRKILEHIRHRNLIFDHPGEVYKWLNTTAYNTALDWIEGHKRLIEDDISDMPLVAPFDEEAYGQEEAYDQYRSFIAPLLPYLTKEQQQVLLLRVMYELSPAEIAEALSKKIGSIRSTLNRARERILAQYSIIK
ncbi:MAG: RNA polymerase sigma factor [Candidatus Roizmanbacteria bacterium]|nr:RNA polymerase sigma factor [Candidatus Roizmanbacteria bacterium]